VTPEEKSLRDMWLSECWHLHPEWRQTRDERADAAARNARLTSVDDAGDSTAEGAA
jgi:hypothetical protein